MAHGRIGLVYPPGRNCSCLATSSPKANANRAVKPDGRGKICSRFGRIKHYIARPAETFDASKR